MAFKIFGSNDFLESSRLENRVIIIRSFCLCKGFWYRQRQQKRIRNVWRNLFLMSEKKTILERDHCFSLPFFRKWIWTMLMRRKCKILFEQPRNMQQNPPIYLSPSAMFIANSRNIVGITKFSKYSYTPNLEQTFDRRPNALVTTKYPENS